LPLEEAVVDLAEEDLVVQEVHLVHLEEVRVVDMQAHHLVVLTSRNLEEDLAVAVLEVLQQDQASHHAEAEWAQLLVAAHSNLL